MLSKHVGKKKRWTEDQLKIAAKNSYSIRQILFNLGLVPAGGNYAQIQKYLSLLNVDISHLKGKGWNKGLKGKSRPIWRLSEILVKDSSYQSFKLKNRLFSLGIKQKQCEMCGWAEISSDGRLPLELDHINGDRKDNRIQNLRVLCPNCHSLQPTHRSRNRKSLVH